MVVRTGGVAGFLQIHSKINDIGKYLHVPLHVAAQYPKTGVGLAVAGYKARNNSMEGRLAGSFMAY